MANAKPNRLRRALRELGGAHRRLPVRREEGQALVEFALVLLPLVLILFGTLEFGRAWNNKNTAVHIANEAARMAAVNQVNCTTLRSEASADGLSGSTTISISAGSPLPQQPVVATVTVPFSSSIPLISSILSAAGVSNLHGTATMLSEQTYAGASC